jgi:hypothetical protein
VVGQTDKSEIAFCSVASVTVKMRDLAVLLPEITVEVETKQTPAGSGH